MAGGTEIVASLGGVVVGLTGMPEVGCGGMREGWSLEEVFLIYLGSYLMAEAWGLAKKRGRVRRNQRGGIVAARWRGGVWDERGRRA